MTPATFAWLSLFREVTVLAATHQEVALWKSFNAHNHEKGEVQESRTPEGILAYWPGDHRDSGMGRV